MLDSEQHQPSRPPTQAPIWAPDAADLPLRPVNPEHTGVLAMFSENRKEGRWWLPRHLRVLSVCGSAKLDLRDAIVEPGLSLIHAVSVLGNIEIIVPQEIGVECDGDALAGTFELKFEGKVTTAGTSGRVVRVIGSSYSGTVTVIVKGRPTEGVLARLGRSLGLG
jgi:Cell wall-active antibiotics response 4TMS YvqF